MNAWCHLPTIIKRRKVLQTAGLATLFVAFITTLFFTVPTEAATGVNQNLNFQARLLNNSGGVVPDGYYNIQFKIYQDGNGLQPNNTGGSPAGELKWTETYVNNGGTGGVLVKNGYLSVTLGSKTPFGNAIDWNQDTLWLSMNIAGDETECADFDLCSPDGEMLPMKRLTATPFALNAARLGGFEADDFMQKTDTLQTGSLWLSEAVRSNTALQAPVIDTATAGNLTIGGTNATSITMADDVTIAAGKSLTLAGGNTASRPASPTEGMLYFDTTTKQLLVYASGKWQGESKTATKIVAASNSPQAVKDGADYVATGTGDQAIINAALTAAAGGKVYLAEGTYTVNASISVPNNTTLSGAGSGTLITIPNGLNSNINAVTNTTTGGSGAGITIRELKLDGNKSNQTSGVMYGIVFNGAGDSATAGSRIENITATNWYGSAGSGIALNATSNTVITGSTLYGNENGIYIYSGGNNTVTSNVVRSNLVGIRLHSTSNNTVTGNTVQTNSNIGIRTYTGANNNTITGNSLLSNGNDNITIESSNDTIVSSNTISGNGSSGRGILLNGATNTVVSSNTISNTNSYAISLSSANSSSIANNLITNSGGLSSNNAIYLNASDRNNINGNSITDSSSTLNNFAINIFNNTSEDNYLANNTLNGGEINDAGTGTIHGGQTSSAGNYVIQPAGTIELQKSTNVTGSLSASNAVLAPAIDRATSGTLTIGETNATSITIGRASANTTTTILGTAVFKPTTGNDSANAFQIQRANGTALFTADTINQTITIGDPSSANKTIISTVTGQITKYGTARNVKQIRLAAEYTGSVLDAGTGSNNSGTMTSSVDLTNRMNYYRWTSSQTSAQTYDIVVQIPIPQDFSAWTDSTPLSLSSRTSNTSDGAINFELRDSSGNVQCDFVSLATNTAWVTHTPNCLSGVYTPGDYLTMRIRVSSKDNASVDVGNIVLNYLSKY